jgi:S-DNA-T family DNA segregation ATPase FtsK/SpoIIIE
MTVEMGEKEAEADGKSVAADYGDLSTPYDPKRDLENYKYPTLDLLQKYESDGKPYIDMEEQTRNKNRIVEVLRSFGVEISSIKATVGPTITLYEITPASGVRISKIKNLEDDIALSLAALGIRIIAPIPGKGTVGIEVPNAKPATVSMESILNSKKFQESTMELPCAVGKTITNEVFMFDLAKAPHLLVAGATGQGKSVGLNAIITSLLYKKHPAEMKIVLVDPKKVEFSVYSSIENHFLAKIPDDDAEPIITDVTKVIHTLNSLCKEMDTRYDLLKMAQARNIKEYNKKFIDRQLNPQNGHKYMPYIVVVIDEFGDLIMTAGKEVELPIARIAQLARAVGIHMIIATQRPTTNIITGTIKANFPSRIAFRVGAMIDSRTILDRPGAQQLIGRGDMLYLNGGEPVRVQCAFVDTPEVERINQFIAEQQGYLSAFELPLPDLGEEEGGESRDVDMQHLDPMFEDAARLIVREQSGSTSLIQRKFAIGYNRAGRLMDQLEKAGIVGAAHGSKPREVLIMDENSLENLLAQWR